jgi:hypothetical protein
MHSSCCLHRLTHYIEQVQFRSNTESMPYTDGSVLCTYVSVDNIRRLMISTIAKLGAGTGSPLGVRIQMTVMKIKRVPRRAWNFAKR